VKSPMTNESLADTRLIPNHALKANIDEAVENAMRELRASRQNGNFEREGAAASGKKRRPGSPPSPPPPPRRSRGGGGPVEAAVP
jgi:hypothetical protein